jgi:hypothetical protein
VAVKAVSCSRSGWQESHWGFQKCSAVTTFTLRHPV